MNRFGRMGRFGDTGPVVMPSSIPQGMPPPNSLPLAPSQDFFDPAADGSDVMFYSTSLASIAAAATANSQIQIDSGVDFYWFASSVQADIAGAVQTESSLVVPLVTVVINDTGSRKNLMNAAVPVWGLAGPGERPYRLVRPRLFRASSTINFTWLNTSAATTYANLILTFHGYTKPRNT